jgi:hypothetical protein
MSPIYAYGITLQPRLNISVNGILRIVLVDMVLQLRNSITDRSDFFVGAFIKKNFSLGFVKGLLTYKACTFLIFDSVT